MLNITAPAIGVHQVSKKYQLGVIGSGSLKHDVKHWLARRRGESIGQAGTADDDPHRDFWALRDVNLEVDKGESVSIIGKNGSGKSTLLKLLSRVTAPTEGWIGINGTTASLLEVGTGFHPELTGRENVFLNGAILGLTKPMIAQRLDEIIEFSGVAEYIDTPVKRFSSGMKVRLAFAVAAHVNPEILIVDEVLAVGDAEFQRRAIAKMRSLAAQADRTILFVSHDMTAVEDVTERTLVLADGRVDFVGSSHEAVEHYLEDATGRGHAWRSEIGDVESTAASQPHILEISADCGRSGRNGSFSTVDPVTVAVRYRTTGSNRPVTMIRIVDETGRVVFGVDNAANRPNVDAVEVTTSATIPADLLAAGLYSVDAAIAETSPSVVHHSVNGAVIFRVSAPQESFPRLSWPGELSIRDSVAPPVTWASKPND